MYKERITAKWLQRFVLHVRERIKDLFSERDKMNFADYDFHGKDQKYLIGSALQDYANRHLREK